MSVDWFILSPRPVEQIIPASFGLGGELFPWDHPNSRAGWVHDDARIWLHPRPAIDFAGPELPAWVRSVVDVTLAFEPVGYGPDDEAGDVLEDLRDDLAVALGGVASNDHAVRDPRERARWAAGPSDGSTVRAAIDAARGALFADRWVAARPDLTPMVEAAVGGHLGAVAVLTAWCRRERAEEDFFEPICDALARVERAPDALLAVFATANHRAFGLDPESGRVIRFEPRFSPGLVDELGRCASAMERWAFARKVRGAP